MEPTNTISTALRKSSIKARRAAWVLVSLIIVTVFILIFFFFVYTEKERPSYIGGSLFEYRLEEDLNWTKPVANDKKESDDIKKLRIELELKKVQVKKEQQQDSGMISAVSNAVARVGAVFIGIYLIQIILSITRYHFRLSDHLLVSAEALDICCDDLEKLESLMGVIATNHIEFGKSPNTPIEKILDVVKESLSKSKTG